MPRSAPWLGLLGVCASACSEPSAPPSNVGKGPSAIVIESARASPSGVATASSSATAAEPAPSASTSAPSDSAASSMPTPSSPPPPGAPTVTSCVGSNKRLYGSTCCEARGSRQEEHPGEVFLDCSGPQIGKACAKKADCDVVCFCKGQTSLVSPGASQAGPADGTRGQTGFCGAQLQVGVWMCEIDEKGAVTHVIVD